jgi:hypothetical protein
MRNFLNKKQGCQSIENGVRFRDLKSKYLTRLAEKFAATLNPVPVHPIHFPESIFRPISSPPEDGFQIKAKTNECSLFMVQFRICFQNKAAAFSASDIY